MVRLLLAILGLALLADPASGQEISPLVYDLTADGSPAAQQVRIANTGNSPLAFEIVASERTYDELGRKSESPAQGFLSVFPDALWLEPGESRQVLVRYTGPAVEQSRLYIVRFRQAPVRIMEGEDATGIDLQYEFLTIAKVHPAGARADLHIASCQSDGDFARVTVVNEGSRIGRIDDGELRLVTANRTIEISSEALAARFEATWLLPGARRILRIPLPSDMANMPISAQWTPSVVTSARP